MNPRVKGRTTIRTAAALFVVSAILEVMDYGSATALFGGVHTGIAAVLYHALFTILYFLCGVGLWRGDRWGYWAVMTTTAAYTIDKVQLVLFPEALYDYLLQQLTVTRDIIGWVPRQSVLQVFTVVYILLVGCWWGFAIYIHMRRSYFRCSRLT